MNERFCLVDQGWIPCERADGARVVLGIRETLAHAHELRAIADSSPLVTAALHRLLLAILHRCFGPSDVTAWIDLYRAGRFDVAVLDAYLDRWRERFDLFHPQRPFYQVRGLALRFEAKPIRELVSEQSKWGNGVFLFEHRPSIAHVTLNFSDAAKWLLAFHACAPEGRVGGEPVSATAAPFNRAAMVLVEGRTCFETLLFNLLIYAPEEGKPIPGYSEHDLPAWERQPLPTSLAESHEPHRIPDGWIDLLTWQSRRLELHVNNGMVAGWVRCVGQGLARGTPRDPMVAWKAHEVHGWLPLGFNRRRASWRDCHALFRATGTSSDVEQPRTLRQLGSDLRTHVPAERRLSLNLLGLSGKKASISLVRAEQLPVSPKLLAHPEIGQSISEVLGFAETGARALHSALTQLARFTLPKGDPRRSREAVQNLTRSLGADARYWSRAKMNFDAYLERVAGDEEGARGTFAEAIRREARRCFGDASRALGTSGRVLKGAAMAADTLAKTLAEIPTLEATEAAP